MCLAVLYVQEWGQFHHTNFVGLTNISFLLIFLLMDVHFLWGYFQTRVGYYNCWESNLFQLLMQTIKCTIIKSSSFFSYCQPCTIACFSNTLSAMHTHIFSLCYYGRGKNNRFFSNFNNFLLNSFLLSFPFILLRDIVGLYLMY